MKQDLKGLQAIETEIYNRWNMLPEYNNRYQAHIQTDKVVYRPLDVMFIEVFVLDAFSKKPLEASQWPSTNVGLEIVDGTDNVVHSESTAEMSVSTIAFSYKLPEDAPGGEYMIKIAGYNVPCVNKIVRVRDYDRQQLVIQTEWDRDTYFPEETVTGTIKVTPADGYAFKSAPSIDYSIGFGDFGIPVEKKGEKLDIKTNEYRISFKVPEFTDVQYATMSIVVDTGSVKQASTKVLVIAQPDKVFLEFFPESNFIVPGVQNRIFFQAWANEQMSEIVDFGHANLVSVDGKPLQKEIGTFHRGKGYFSFTPKLEEKYFLDLNLGGKNGRVQRELPPVEKWMQTNVNF